MVEGMKIDDKVIQESCEGRALGKQTRYPFPKSSEKKTEVLELVHSDICGLMNTLSVGDARMRF